MMEELAHILLIIIVFAFGAILGSCSQMDTMQRDCERMGKTRNGPYVIECSVKPRSKDAL